MLNIKETSQVYVYFKPVDLRKSIDGLCAVALDCLSGSLRNGDIFIFRNKRRTKLKLIFWDRNGFVMYYKRLDKGGFKFPTHPEDDSAHISAEQLDWLLMGFNFMLTDATQAREPAYFY